MWWIHAISALNDTWSFIHVGLVSNLREKGFGLAGHRIY